MILQWQAILRDSCDWVLIFGFLRSNTIKQFPHMEMRGLSWGLLVVVGVGSIQLVNYGGRRVEVKSLVLFTPPLHLKNMNDKGRPLRLIINWPNVCCGIRSEALFLLKKIDTTNIIKFIWCICIMQYCSVIEIYTSKPWLTISQSVELFIHFKPSLRLTIRRMSSILE